MVKVTRKTEPGAKFFEQAIKDLNDFVAKVGWMKSAKYADGTHVAEAAVVNEYGDPSKGIPPRSFLRTTRKEKEQYWSKVFVAEMRRVLKGEVTVTQALDTMSQIAAGDVRKKISQIQDPKLKDATVAARLRKMKDGKTVGNLTKPLVESGTMLNTCIGVVEKNDTGK